MTTEAVMTELEAVNLMLRSIGESPVSSLSATGYPPLDVAKQVLTEENRRVQGRGWDFNTDYDVVWTPDGSGEIALGTAVLEFRPVSSSRWRNLVERNRKVWDKDEQSYNLGTSDVYVNVTYVLDYTEIPHVAREYIAYKAAIRFQQQYLGSGQEDAALKEGRDSAYEALIDSQSRTSKRNLFTHNSWAHETLRR